MLGIDCNDLSARSIKIGFDPEDPAVVVDELVLRVESIEQFHDFCIRVRQVLVVKAILRRSSLPDRDHEVMTVISNLSRESEFFVIGALVYQLVVRLLRTQAMNVEFLEVIRIAQRRS